MDRINKDIGKAGMLFLMIIVLNAFIHEACLGQGKQEIKNFPVPKVLSFDTGLARYQPLLDGEKDTVVFYSGVVTLGPGI